MLKPQKIKENINNSSCPLFLWDIVINFDHAPLCLRRANCEFREVWKPLYIKISHSYRGKGPLFSKQGSQTDNNQQYVGY